MMIPGPARAYDIDEVERRLAAPAGVAGVSPLDLPTPALAVRAAVVSKNYDDVATIDAGLKAFATDRTFGPEPLIEGAAYLFNGDEHGRLHLENAAREVKLGDKVELIVPHCAPTLTFATACMFVVAIKYRPSRRSPHVVTSSDCLNA
jgi:D-serine deaminase-like pyridoxal phosphate-dependent protein